MKKKLTKRAFNLDVSATCNLNNNLIEIINGRIVCILSTDNSVCLKLVLLNNKTEFNHEARAYRVDKSNSLPRCVGFIEHVFLTATGHGVWGFTRLFHDSDWPV